MWSIIALLTGILCSALMLAGGLSSDERKSLQEAGWLKVQRGSFSLLIPPRLRAVPVQPIDSIVGRWVSTNIVLDFDQGAFSASIVEGPATESLTVDGKRAVLCIVTNWSGEKGFASYAAIYFHDIELRPPLGPRLRLSAKCKTAADIATARTIFESIESLAPDQWSSEREQPIHSETNRTSSAAGSRR